MARAIQQKPLCLSFSADLSAEDIFEGYRRWDDDHARPLLPAVLRHDNDRDPDRRLRVGYVSADFRACAANCLFEPLLAAHDRAVLDLVCYSGVADPDAATARVQGLADHWRPIVGLDDQTIAEMILEDRIDLLVDLTGHRANGRLLVFARKPAPVQVCYFIGDGYTSGLSAMDAVLADAVLVPPGAESLFSEAVVRLPRLPFCYRPPADMPEVGPLPALTNGYVTFGCLSGVQSINDRVVALWARLLHGVPDSRLLVTDGLFGEADACSELRDRFAVNGIESERLELVPATSRCQSWAVCHQIDVALDPFPHNAGVATIEALWLGLPVLSLADRPSVGRLGAGVLGCVGLTRWAVATPEDYLAVGIAAAHNLDRLAALRAGLRARVARSPLLDPDGLARAVEDAYRDLWYRWCATPRPEIIADPEITCDPKVVPDYRQVVAAWRAGKADEVRRLCAAMLAAEPEHPDALHTLGLLAQRNGEATAAGALIGRAIASDPQVPEYHASLASVLYRLHRLDEAEAACRCALDLLPAFPDALDTLGQILAKQGRLEDAMASFRKAIDLAPDRHPEAWDNLARLLMRSGRMVAAEQLLIRACQLWPGNPALYDDLGAVLAERGWFGAAEEAFQRALTLEPDRASSHSARLSCLDHNPDWSAEEIVAEYRRWDETQARPRWPAGRGHANDRDPERRLRVGYVFSTVGDHPARRLLESLLAAHDRSVIETFCYDEAARDDQSVIGMIRDDRIDLLVDLNGHTAGGRPLVFAAKPAPVQVSYLIGQGYGSGLSVMDGVLADEVLVPAGCDGLFGERVIRLPRSLFCFLPPADMPPVGPVPALTKGYVTFGCFSRRLRLNDLLIGWWARLLDAVPGSRLVLDHRAMVEAAGRARLCERFAGHGIGPERLDLVFTTPAERTWAAYHEIDIALDPFPHNAGLTSLEALWMGVPVLTLADRPPVGRLGASILSALGLEEWVAATPEDYVAIGAVAGADPESLVPLRAGLRDRLRESPLCDAAGLARDVEAVYRELWRDWCSKTAFADDQGGDAG